MANRLGDSRSRAYSLAGEIHVSTTTEPKPLPEFEALKSEAIKAASDTPDAYIQNWTMFVIGWEEFHRGRMNDARNAARELMQIGQRLNDPRSTGLGLALLTWIALACGSYNEALEYAEQSLAVAITPWDRIIASDGKGSALILLQQTKEGAQLLEEDCRRCVADGDLYSLAGNEGTLGVCRVLEGNIGQGIRLLEEGILRREHEGLRTVADWYRVLLSQVYLQIIGGNEKPPLSRVLKNLPIILKVMATASSRIHAMNRRITANPHLDPVGHHFGSAHMVLGLLYKIKKKRALALEHLTEAQRILSPFGQSPTLARVETALAELRNST
jgi:tetratricopeptide (TPR) repeat protein